MDFTDTLKRKAARARKQVYLAYVCIVPILAVIISDAYAKEVMDLVPTHERHRYLGIIIGLVVSAWLLVQLDCFLRPEESLYGIRQAKTRHRVFLAAWAVIIVALMWGRHFMFWLPPCGLWLGYAIGLHSMHRAFYLVEHPNAPKSILLSLPIESTLNSWNLAFGLGILSAGISLLLWVLGLKFRFAWQTATLAAACLCSILTVWLLVPTVAVRFGGIKKYHKWLWQVIKYMPTYKNPSEKAQFDLFAWCLMNPGRTNPPQDLLKEVYADYSRLMLPGAVPGDGKKLPELSIGVQADFLAQHLDDVSPTRRVTPLFRAAARQDVAAMRRLLPDPLHINQPYAGNGNTLLHIAAWNGNTEMVQLLLSQPYIKTGLTNHAGQTPLDIAREKHFTDIVKLLQAKQPEK